MSYGPAGEGAQAAAHLHPHQYNQTGHMPSSVTQSRDRGVVCHGTDIMSSRKDIMSTVEGTETRPRTSNPQEL